MASEEFAPYIGVPTGGSTFEVEKEPIRRFADAVGDSSPLYSDEEYAKKAGYRSLVAPPGYISIQWNARQRRPTPPAGGKPGAPPFGGKPGGPPAGGKPGAPPGEGRMGIMAVLRQKGYTNPGGVDGGIEYDFFKPVQAGDTITASSMMKDVIEREGRTGKMAFLISETTYTNQNGEIVAKARSTTIQR
jgi:acyl dehydratase